MKKIKLPLEMANGVMVHRTIDELKENWDLTKVVEHFVSGKLVTWLNDRYYSDIAEKIENLPKDDGKKLQQALCKAFDMPCEDVELDVDEIAERKRRKDLLRQYTSDEKILDNVDHVAFNQEELADLLDEGIAEIYLCNNKFIIPLNVSGKKYVGVGSVEVNIGKKELVDFKQLGIDFVDVKFDAQYEALIAEKKAEEEKKRQAKKVGDIIVLGRYENEPIEWQVLDLKEGKALVISKFALTACFYHTGSTTSTWEYCNLRKELNKGFYQEVFNSLPIGVVVDSNVPAHRNPMYNTDIGNDTVDKVFVLSVEELSRYFKTDRERLCYPKEGVTFLSGPCNWWLRTPGINDSLHSATYIDRSGAVHYDGEYGEKKRLRGQIKASDIFAFRQRDPSEYEHYFQYEPYCVRPACWIDLSKLE